MLSIIDLNDCIILTMKSLRKVTRLLERLLWFDMHNRGRGVRIGIGLAVFVILAGMNPHIGDH